MGAKEQSGRTLVFSLPGSRDTEYKIKILYINRSQQNSHACVPFSFTNVQHYRYPHAALHIQSPFSRQLCLSAVLNWKFGIVQNELRFFFSLEAWSPIRQVNLYIHEGKLNSAHKGEKN